MSGRAVSTEAEFSVSPEDLWGVLMDPSRLEDWVTTHDRLEGDAPERLETGSTFGQRMKLAGKSFKVTWTVAELERPNLAVWEGEGPAGSKAHVRYELEPAGDGGTRFTYENEFELPGGILGRAAGRTVGDRVSRREAEKSLENLARVVEG